MSLNAQYHAEMFLKGKPSPDQVRVRLAELHQSEEYWREKSRGAGGEDAFEFQRQAHMSRTEIKVLEAHLKSIGEEP